jgi:hypothetical protein
MLTVDSAFRPEWFQVSVSVISSQAAVVGRV